MTDPKTVDPEIQAHANRLSSVGASREMVLVFLRDKETGGQKLGDRNWGTEIGEIGGDWGTTNWDELGDRRSVPQSR
jgi:hypothetical protein